MTFNTMDPFYEQLKQLASGPRNPDRFYLLSKYTYKEIYALSSGIRNACFSDTEETICLCVMDKGLIAAAFLAAITSPVTLVIPHSFSESAISDMVHAIPFSKAITDQAIQFPTEVETFVIDTRQMLKTQYSPGALRSPDSIFLKLFTGGSTGAPKIWSKTIRNMFGEAFFLSDKFSISSADRFAATVPPIHIYGLLFTVLVPLVASAAVLDGVFTYPHEIHRSILNMRSTVLISIPIHYRVLKGNGMKRESLRLAFSSAGKLNQADSNAFFEQTGLGVIEIYGSTESGGIATRCCVKGQEHFFAYECVDWKIEEDQLHVRSDFVSPDIDRDDDGFIEIGDQVRSDNKEGFKLIGRADRIVKVAGKRVDLDEVKNKIIQLANVTDALVLSTKSQTGRENEIWALIEGNIGKNEFKQQIMTMLESYAMPRRIRIVENIPVSSTGKYDKTTIERIFQKNT
jgi:acyl-coenzyme A synthetase/AMP-(fatty) acid ligase